jgi:nucleotide-binding universal stress UspA family protein
MKTILALTDFSGPAENAVLYAGRIASSIGASVLLVHIYQIPVSMNDMPIMMISGEDLKQSSDDSLERVKELLQKHEPSLVVKTESRLGDISSEIQDLCEKDPPFLIVAGKHGSTGVERFLFGSNSLSIIRHAKVPVVIVPDSSTINAAKNIALAIDATDHSLPLQQIRNITQELGARLELVHIQTDKEEKAVPSYIQKELNASLTTLPDHDFVEGIRNFATSHQTDLVMMLPHKHSLVEKLFFRTHTSELMQKLSLPILCIPAV